MSRSTAAATATVGSAAVLGLIGVFRFPENAVGWLVLALLPTAFWLLIESITPADTAADRAIKRYHRMHVAVFAVYILFEVCGGLASSSGVLGPDERILLRRVRGVFVGSVFIVLGNTLPKLMSPWSLKDEPFDWQGVHRFVGRVFILAGIALVTAWLFMPIEQSDELAIRIVLVMVVLAVGRKFVSVVRYSA